MGAGVNTAVFAVTYGVLLRPLPYEASSQLVIFSTATGGEFDIRLGEPQEWQSRLRSFERASAYSGGVFTARCGEATETLRTGLVSDDFFEVLRPTSVAGSLSGLARRTNWAVIGSTMAADVCAIDERVERFTTDGDARLEFRACLVDTGAASVSLRLLRRSRFLSVNDDRRVGHQRSRFGNVLDWAEIIHSIAPDNIASQQAARKLHSRDRGPGQLPPPYEHD